MFRGKVKFLTGGTARDGLKAQIRLDSGADSIVWMGETTIRVSLA